MAFGLGSFLQVFYSLWAKIYLRSRRANLLLLDVSGEMVERKPGASLLQNTSANLRLRSRI
jgi:hypothetical protein